MGNVVYDNFYLANEVEDQFNSHLDLQRFAVIDNTLEGVAGMEKKINRYRASNATQKLAMGEGNTESIEVSYSQLKYTVGLAQNRFEYFDEQAMTDPMLVPTGARHMGTDMFNTVNADIYTEFKKASRVIVTQAFGFNDFADAVSLMNVAETDNDPAEINAFAFVNPKDVASIRKTLKDELKYVEAFARRGYVGTVAGVDIYTKKDATRGTITVGVLGAVTVFNKRGVEIERPQRDSNDANVRKNTIFSRKYYLAALTDDNKAVQIIQGTASVSADTSVSASKTYYEDNGTGYIEVTPVGTENPHNEGWYEITPSF